MSARTLPTAAVEGTDRLGRPLTSAEKGRFANLLREHNYVGARLVALRFAYKLTRGRGSAQDLMGRADLRLVRQGWDPNEVTLVKRLCRLVWSEWTHEGEESSTTRRAEEVFLRETGTTAGGPVPSARELAARGETRREERASATGQLEKLRASFQEARDEVNLLWLEYTLQDISDLKEMERRSGRDVIEFYRAADRRKRHVKRLIALSNGVKDDEEDE